MEPALSSTPSEPRPDPLVGRYVRLLPLVRGFFRRDALALMWAAVEEEGATLDILYGRRSMAQTTPFDTRGDLVDFVEYFKGDDKLVVLVEAEDELAGFLWLEDMVPGFRGTVNLFFRKKYRGRVAFEAGRLFRDYCCGVLGFKSLWGLTPWKHSVVMGKWLGMKQIAVLPSFQLIDGQARDVYVIRYEAPNGF